MTITRLQDIGSIYGEVSPRSMSTRKLSTYKTTMALVRKP